LREGKTLHFSSCNARGYHILSLIQQATDTAAFRLHRDGQEVLTARPVCPIVLQWLEALLSLHLQVISIKRQPSDQK
jgi:hypothetical protein